MEKYTTTSFQKSIYNLNHFPYSCISFREGFHNHKAVSLVSAVAVNLPSPLILR